MPPSREFLTDAGLAAPGNKASFKVYVITTTGNEKGSNAVTVTRPAGTVNNVFGGCGVVTSGRAVKDRANRQNQADP